MAVFKIVEVPEGRARRHVVTGFVRYLVGPVLILASVLAAFPLVFLGAGGLVLALAGDPVDIRSFTAGDLAFLGGSFAVSVVCWWVGSRVIRGRRRLVLFLRRFGFTSATEALTSAIGAGLGRRWRLVTLDDHQIAPLGVRRTVRWSLWLGRLAAVGLTAAAVWFAVSWISGDAPAELLREISESAVTQAEAEGADPITAIIGSLFITLIAGAVVLTFAILAVLTPAAITGTALLFTAGGARSVRQAERAKAVLVARDRDVRRSASRARAMTRRVMAPRIIVVRVTDRLWQREVDALAALADVVLVDISEPSENLLWEIRLLERAGARWLPIGRVDRLRAVQIDGTPCAAGVRSAVDGRWVLGYQPASLAAFSPALRTALGLTIRRTPAHGRPRRV